MPADQTEALEGPGPHAIDSDVIAEAPSGRLTPDEMKIAVGLARARAGRDSSLSPGLNSARVACAWYCALCRRCHANACPSLWGGSPEVPCAARASTSNETTPVVS